MRESLKCRATGNRKKRNISMRTSLQVRIRFSNANSATINITYDELFVRAYLLTHVIANDAFVWRR